MNTGIGNGHFLLDVTTTKKSIMKMLYILIVGLFFSGLAQAETLKLQYDGFTVWLDCERRGATQFYYKANADSGSHKRSPNYFIDIDMLTRSCSSSMTVGNRC